MTIKSLHDLFRKANCSETRIEQLQELVDLENETLCAAVALHPNCKKDCLQFANTLRKKLKLKFP